MRRIVLILFVLAFGPMNSYAQQAKVQLDLFVKQFNGVNYTHLDEYRVQLLDSSSNVTIPPVISDLYTSSLGKLDSLYDVQYHQGRLTVRVLDCAGSIVYEGNRLYDTLFTSYPVLHDTAYVNCVNPCEGMAVDSSLGGGQYHFEYILHPSWSGADATWEFQDGSVLSGSSAVKGFNPGTYWFRLRHRGCTIDSTSIAILPSQNCQAEFIVDTVNSFNSQLVVWNVSKIDSNASGRDFIWHFGDGDTSQAAYPTHVYSDPGKYELKLILLEYASNGDTTCYTSYRDSVGMDAQGNLLYKTGFALSVMNPNSIGIDERESPKVLFYPQPASGNITIQSESPILEVRLLDISGRTLDRIRPNTRSCKMHLHKYPGGVYVIHVDTELGNIVEKCILH